MANTSVVTGKCWRLPRVLFPAFSRECVSVCCYIKGMYILTCNLINFNIFNLAMVFFLIRCDCNHLIGPLLLCALCFANTTFIIRVCCCCVPSRRCFTATSLCTGRLFGHTPRAGHNNYFFLPRTAPCLTSEWVYACVDPVLLFLSVSLGSPWILSM